MGKSHSGQLVRHAMMTGTPFDGLALVSRYPLDTFPWDIQRPCSESLAISARSGKRSTHNHFSVSTMSNI